MALGPGKPKLLWVPRSSRFSTIKSFGMSKTAVLFDASRAVLSTFDLDEVLQRILAIARDHFHLRNVAVLMLDAETQQLCVRSQIGWDPGQDRICLAHHEGITGAAVAAKQPVYVPN